MGQTKTKGRDKAATIITDAPGPQVIPPVAQKAEIVPFSQATNDALVRPVVSAEDAKARWDEYTAICRAILEPNDYTYYACAKKPDGYDVKPVAFRTRVGAEKQLDAWKLLKFTELVVRETKKRSAWDKLARFYGISTPIESEALCTTAEVVIVGEYVVEKLLGDSFKIFCYQEAGTLTVRKVTVLLRCVSPNGRTIIGDGACAATERSFAHADHDIFSTAFTRAFNRGVSRCIGTGEVSAEEFEAATPEPSASTTVSSAPVQQVSKEAPKAIAQETKHEPKPEAKAEPKYEPTKTEGKSEPVPSPAKAEIPTTEQIQQSGRQPSLPMNSPQPHQEKSASATTLTPQPAVSDKFTPLDETATLPNRILAMKKYLFGSEVADDRLVEYLFFCIKVNDPAVEIEQSGRLHPAKWNAAMRALEDRKARMTSMETILVKIGRDGFVSWGRALVDAARARKTFGSK